MSDRTYNIEISDKDGRTFKVRGVPLEGVKAAKETLRQRAVDAEYQPPFYYMSHQMGGGNGKRR